MGQGLSTQDVRVDKEGLISMKDDKSRMIKVYFRSSRVEDVGTDDDNMPILDEVGRDILQIRDMDMRDYEDFVERESVSAGEEGGYFKVLVVTMQGNQIVSDHILRHMAEELRSCDQEAEEDISDMDEEEKEELKEQLREEYGDIIETLGYMEEHGKAYGHDLQDDEGRDAVTVQTLETRLAELRKRMTALGITFSGGK